MNKIVLTQLILLSFVVFSSNLITAKKTDNTFAKSITQVKSIDQKVDSLLKLMTLEEKVGQMNQYNGDWAATGPITHDGNKQSQIREGKVGSMLNITSVNHTRTLQEIALQSRLKIPLLFGQDVIHGYRTTFPIPLAEAASWDLSAMELSARIAAIEASSVGVHWTFAPMVDVTRDPRWGRVMEGAGEDTYLGSEIAKARVKGFQGNGYGSTDAVMACAKHFVAYGAAVGGRDYNSVDMSLRQLHEVYLPPFKAALDVGVATFMNSFNDINGIPATGSEYLQRDILKDDWQFEGFVVSDWGSVGEMINHGFVKDGSEAAMAAANAGCDMDMESRSYINNLVKLVTEGKVEMDVIDDAVRRILKLKFEMGLFDDPFKFCDETREKEQRNNKEHLKAARDISRKSIVLLKNENQLLPISKKTKSIAMIGPFVHAKSDNLGFWSYDFPDDSVRIASLWEGVKKKLDKNSELLYAKGCEISDSSKNGFSAAIEIANKSDVVILSVGEARDMSGEAKSRSNIHLPGVQEELIKAVMATGKPVIVLISAGRPLIFNWTADNVPAILYTWWLGTEAGNAISDVLFGDYNPSAKLPMSFPRSEGQIPIYYNQFNTGRPATNDEDRFYRSAYTDLSIYPKYAFGYGLSYSEFKYDNIQLSKTKITAEEQIEVECTITNTSDIAGEEIVQLYIRDLFASLVRPIKELKDFKKIQLNAGESKTIKFIIDKEKLSFFNQKLQWIAEPGDFNLMIGAASDDIRLENNFELVQ